MALLRIVCTKACKLAGQSISPGTEFALVHCPTEAARLIFLTRLGWSAFRVEPAEGGDSIDAALASELATVTAERDALFEQSAELERIKAALPDEPQEIMSPLEALAHCVLEVEPEQLAEALPYIGPENAGNFRAWAGEHLEQLHAERERLRQISEALSTALPIDDEAASPFYVIEEVDDAGAVTGTYLGHSASGGSTTNDITQAARFWHEADAEALRAILTPSEAWAVTSHAWADDDQPNDEPDEPATGDSDDDQVVVPDADEPTPADHDHPDEGPSPHDSEPALR